MSTHWKRDAYWYVIGFIAATLLCYCNKAHAEPFLDLGAGATFFIPKNQDGTWYQEAFPHHFDTTDLALRAGVGWRFNEQWKTTVSYLRLGSVSATSLVVNDADYDPNAHRCLANCTTPTYLKATDTVQGGEWSVTRTFPFEAFSPFLRAGGALMFHALRAHAVGANGHEADINFDGRVVMALVGGGLCYKWVCAEATYYHGITNTNFPISTQAIVPMVSVQVPLW